MPTAAWACWASALSPRGLGSRPPSGMEDGLPVGTVPSWGVALGQLTLQVLLEHTPLWASSDSLALGTQHAGRCPWEGSVARRHARAFPPSTGPLRFSPSRRRVLPNSSMCVGPGDPAWPWKSPTPIFTSRCGLLSRGRPPSLPTTTPGGWGPMWGRSPWPSPHFGPQLWKLC